MGLDPACQDWQLAARRVSRRFMQMVSGCAQRFRQCLSMFHDVDVYVSGVVYSVIER